MDWKLFASTFVAIFVAELGDKTQLATLSLATGGSSRWIVFAGAALALVATTAIAVVAGEAISRVVPAIWLRRGAGVIFLLLGALFLFARSESDDAQNANAQNSSDQNSSDQNSSDQNSSDQNANAQNANAQSSNDPQDPIDPREPTPAIDREHPGRR